MLKVRDVDSSVFDQSEVVCGVEYCRNVKIINYSFLFFFNDLCLFSVLLSCFSSLF